MGKFAAIYLSFDERLVEKVEEMSQKLKQEGYLFTVRYHHEAPWIQLYVEEPESVAIYAEDVSKIFSDRVVIGLAAYTVSDSVIFCQFQDGKVIRLLKSGFQEERQWGKIKGTPQTWELEIFKDIKMEIGSFGMVSYHIQNIGSLLKLPGFGIPRQGEMWTKEIHN